MRSQGFNWVWVLSVLMSAQVCAGPPVDSGALDPTFGSGGKKILDSSVFNMPAGAHIVANDVAVQADGKIVLVGYAAASVSEWIVVRLNADGSYDNTFGSLSNGIAYIYGFGTVDNQAFSVAIRSDGHIVVGGTIRDSNNGLVTAVVVQLTASGAFDQGWGDGGAVYFTPAAGDATRTRALTIDTVNPYALGNVYIVGSYVHGASGNNDFFYAGISVDGAHRVSATYEASLGGNYNDSATGVAVQPSTGNVIVGGFATSAAGDIDCAAISTVIIPNPPLQEAYVYNSYGNGGIARASFNLGGDNNDFCDAMTLTRGGYLVLGGHGTMAVSGGTEQAAIAAMFNDVGTELFNVVSCGFLCLAPFLAQFPFTYDGQPTAGRGNTINKLLMQPYDASFDPQFLAVGYGYDGIVGQGFHTDDFGVGRIGLDGDTYQPLAGDSNFGAGGVSPGYVLEDFSRCGVVGCTFASDDHAQSGTLDPQGRLLVVGTTQDPTGGTDIALARFAPFDGIFTDRFDLPQF